MISLFQTQKQYVLTLIAQYKHNPMIVNLLQLLTFLITKHEVFMKTYSELSQEDTETKKYYFKALVEIFNFCRAEGKQKQIMIIKAVIGKLLDHENNNNIYLDLIPKDIFMEVKNYNPRTYNRKEQRIVAKQEEVVQNSNFIDSLAEYSQIVLILNRYFNEPQIQLEPIWKVIFGIASQCNIDMDKITYLTLNFMMDCNNLNKMRQIFHLFNEEKVKNILVSMVKNNIEDVHQLKLHGHLGQLVRKSQEWLFENKIIAYNPAHIRMIHSLIEANILTFQQLACNLPSTTSEFHNNLNGCIDRVYQSSIQIFIDKIKLQNVQYSTEENTLIMGQIGNCFKLTMMAEYLKNNQFDQAVKIYRSFLTKVQLTIYAPIITEFCYLIEWILEPYLRKNEDDKNVRSHSFPEGYFKQSSELDMATIIQITQILEYIGFNVGYSAKTFKILCRSFNIFLSSKQQVHLEKQQIVAEIKNIIKKYLIAAVSMHEQSSLFKRLQAIIFKFPQNERFEMYCFYRQNVMFDHFILTISFKKGYWKQYFEKKSQFPSNDKLQKIIKFENSNPFRCCHNLMKVLVLDPTQQKTSLITTILEYTSYLISQVMLFFCLQYIVSNEGELMRRYDQPNEKYGNITKFITIFLIEFPDIGLESLFCMCLSRLNEFIPEPLAQTEVTLTHNPNFFFLKIISEILEGMFPYRALDISPSRAEKEQEYMEYLTYGYHLKVYTSELSIKYEKAEKLRKHFLYQLFKKCNNNQTYFYNFIHTLNYQYKKLSRYSRQELHQQDGDKTTEKHAKLMDDCSNTINHLIDFVVCMYIENKEQDKGSQIKQKIRNSFNQLAELNLQMSHLRCVYHFLFSEDLISISFTSNFNNLKDRMNKLVSERFSITKQLAQRVALVHTAQTKEFIFSDFYLFFWISEQYHINNLEQIYCNKMTQIRQKNQSKVSKQLLNSKNIKPIQSIIEHISEEKTYFKYAFDKYNCSLTLEVLQKNRIHSVSKFAVPPAFEQAEKRISGMKTKSHKKVIESFNSLFFTYCILPRMLNSPSDALYCSRFTRKCIHENGISSNRAIKLVFSLIEGAVDFVKYSTEREVTRCIPVFVNDMLKGFKYWNSKSTLQGNLVELNVDALNDSRYQILKNFIHDSMKRITANLLVTSLNDFVKKNIIVFLEKTSSIPLVYEDGLLIIEHFEKMHTMQGLTPFLQSRIGRLISLLKIRNKNVPRMTPQERARKVTQQNKIIDVRGQILNNNRIVNRSGQIQVAPRKQTKGKNQGQKRDVPEKKETVVVILDD